MSGIPPRVAAWAAASLLLAPLAFGQQEWKTSVPFTYLIDYSQGHVNNPEYIKKIAEAPPTLMHVGEDVVFSSVYGTKEGFGGPQGTRANLITAEEARAKLAELQRYTAHMHTAGVRWIIPYINNLAILGDHEKRTGFWEFFDHWNRYREFGFGPQPDKDIVTAQMFPGFPQPRAPKGKDALDPNYPYKRYELCVNNPIWRNYLMNVTRVIAQTGMDGVFSDEMELTDYCSYDQSKFRDYLRQKFAAAELQKLFGSSDVASLHLGYPGEGALWHETQAFWSRSLGDYLRDLRTAGREVNPHFFVISNLGPFAHIDGVFKRVEGGKDPREWAPYCRLIMFEDMQRPGQLAPGVFFDDILQFKLAFGMQFVGGTLLYYSQEAPGVELSMAEAGAGGGGAFIEGGYREPESRKKYRNFFEAHADLFDGYQSQADVAVVFAYDQAYWGNHVHLSTLYPLSQYLSEHHILYDIIPPAQVRSARLSARYKAVITSGLWYLPDNILTELHNFAAQGGLWLDIGDSGKFDERGGVRVRPGVAPRSEQVGTGLLLRRDRIDDVLRLPHFALYWLSESEANDLHEITNLYQASLVPEFPFPPTPEAEDLKALLEANTHTSLSVLAQDGLEGLRCNAWRKAGPDQSEVITAHFVNYYSRIPTRAVFVGQKFELGGPPEEFSPRVLENVAVRLRLAPGRVTSVVVYNPDSPEPVTLKYQQSGDSVEFKLPPIRIYQIVKIVLAPKTGHP
jgi:hypothetical protein